MPSPERFPPKGRLCWRQRTYYPRGQLPPKRYRRCATSRQSVLPYSPIIANPQEVSDERIFACSRFQPSGQKPGWPLFRFDVVPAHQVAGATALRHNLASSHRGIRNGVVGQGEVVVAPPTPSSSAVERHLKRHFGALLIYAAVFIKTSCQCPSHGAIQPAPSGAVVAHHQAYVHILIRACPREGDQMNEKLGADQLTS
jgi:hypothetical protein